MAAPSNEFSFDLETAKKAAEVWRRQESDREKKGRELKRHKYDAVESRERLTKRANRLLEKVQEVTPGGVANLSPVLRDLVERGPIEEHEMDNVLFERVLGATRDFLSVSFLGKGTQVIRSAARIVTSLGDGRVSYGTGSLVSPRLLMTNFHVLPTAENAANSVAEFNYQVDLSGNPLKVERFELNPGTFFFNDKQLDYAIVGVNDHSDTGEPLATFGWCPLVKEEGKIVLGNCVNIIQHPRGEMKQIVIRENKLVDLLDNVLHYEGDTEPGSSGSPVFNDQWEIVGLHHSGVPKTDDKGRLLDIDGKVWEKNDDPMRIDWVANEGIRASRIVSHIEAAKLKPHEERLRDQLLASSKLPQPAPMDSSIIDATTPNATNAPVEDSVKAIVERKTSSGTTSATLSIPLNITISIGDVSETQSVAPVTPQPPSEAFLESIKPDPNYDDRPGYDENFLGFAAPLPTLDKAIRPAAAEIPGKKKGEDLELKYYHYSVIMNAKRRIAFVSAVNLNDAAKVHHEREGKDQWFFDPRIDEDLQAGNEFYSDNPLDRGHLVRRADSAWGSTPKAAKLANDDTFHFTNCSPQHEIFNQSQKATSKHLLLWGNLENHVAKQGAQATKGRLSVFNGPVFRKNDRPHRGLQVPKEFWKIIAYVKDSGKPGAVAFLLSQSQLIKNLPAEDFQPEEYRPFQVRIEEIEKKTKLDFGKLRTYDPLKVDVHESLFESDTEAIGLESLDQIVT